MSFAHPLALLLLLLLVPVALLYWLRPRVPPAVVGTDVFWQKALAEEPLRAGWQRWRMPVSLILQSLTVILLSLAAAGPEIPPPQRIVLILDNSATMRATDVQPSRFDAAKEAARRMIASLRWCDEMAIVTTGLDSVEVQPFTNDRALLVAAVDSTKALPEPPSTDCAVKVAAAIAGVEDGRLKLALQPPTRIVLITDGCDRQAAAKAQQCGVEVLRVGTATGNRAITCFTARRSKVDPAQCQVFVSVQSHDDHSCQGNVELSVDGNRLDAAPFEIEKDGRWQHLFELKLPKAARLSARITPGDAYAFDDSANLNVPSPPSLDVVGSPPVGSSRGIDLRVPANIGRDASESPFASPGMPLWIPLATAAAMLLILELCLHQRRWTS